MTEGDTKEKPRNDNASKLTDSLDKAADRMRDAESFLVGSAMSFQAFSSILGTLSQAAADGKDMVQRLRDASQEATDVIDYVKVVAARKRAERDARG